MDAREVPVAPVAVPASLAAEVTGRAWARDRVGEAGAAVYRLQAPGHADLYLKHGRGPAAEDVADEMARMRWLGRHVSVPDMRAFVFDASGAWLLSTAMPGRTAWQWMHDDPASHEMVVDLLADHLHALHAVPVAECPFDAGYRVRLAQARARIDAGLVDEDDFDAARAGWSAEQVWQDMMRNLPRVDDRVVTHGDFSLDNILIEGGRVTGMIDLGRVGVADRYQDLAILWNCLNEFDAALGERLFARYGIAAPDERRLTFHLCLDEMF